MRRRSWCVRLAIGVAAATLAISGAACSAAPTRTVDWTSPGQAAGTAVQTARLPVSGPVIALSSVDVWAAADEGVLHWNGRQWAFADLPKVPGGAYIDSFAAVSPASIWAVGALTNVSNGDGPLVLHWDGTRWARAYGTVRQRGILDAVTVAGGDVWAVGGTNSDVGSPAIILRLTAGHWHTVPSPARTSLPGLAMTSASDGWASGPGEGQARGPLLHWNGRAWTTAPAAALPAGDDVATLATAPGGPVWGVGNVDPGFAPYSQYWTGRAWRTAPVRWPQQSDGLALGAVTAIPGGSAWAIGYFGPPMPGDKSAIFHWSGRAWTQAWELSRPAGAMLGIGVVSPSDAWSVGYVCTGVNSDNGCSGDQYLILHWNGATWSESYLPTNFQAAG